MNTILSIVGCGALLGGAIFYLVYRNRKLKAYEIRLSGVERQSIEGTLSMKDVVGWFGTRSGLSKGKDIPFVAKLKEQKMQIKDVTLVVEEGLTPNKQGLLLGVYNEELNGIEHSVIVEADAWEEEVEKLFSESDLVVLS